MASATWLQGRVNRMLRHTYTRRTLTQTAAPNDVDAWGEPNTSYSTSEVEDIPCLFLDQSTYVLSPGGPVQLEANTLVIAADDPIALGDQVLEVVDPETGSLIYDGPGTVELFTNVASHGALIYKTVNLLAGEAGESS